LRNVVETTEWSRGARKGLWKACCQKDWRMQNGNANIWEGLVEDLSLGRGTILEEENRDSFYTFG
jgi:hypothetical protein